MRSTKSEISGWLTNAFAIFCNSTVLPVEAANNQRIAVLTDWGPVSMTEYRSSLGDIPEPIFHRDKEVSDCRRGSSALLPLALRS